MIVIPGFPVPIASGAGFGQIPVGGILLYEELTAPAGYEMYYASSMATRALRGVGPLTAEKAVGGVDQYTITGTTNNTGEHIGTEFHAYGNTIQIFPGQGYYTGVQSNGAHTHGISPSWNHAPKAVRYPLIRKVAGPGLIPPGASTLHTQTAVPSGYEVVADYVGRIIRGHNSTIQLLGSDYPTTRTFNTNGAGQHVHGYGARLGVTEPSFGPGTADEVGAGGHSHSITADVDVRLRAVNVAQCRAQGLALVSVGMMIGYDGEGPLGAGWRECNGQNGTVDMRDHYPMIAALAQAGSLHGTGEVIWEPTSISAVGGHNHVGAGRGNVTGHAARHNDYVGGHTHTIPTRGGTVDARWYGMRFIQYIP